MWGGRYHINIGAKLDNNNLVFTVTNSIPVNIPVKVDSGIGAGEPEKKTGIVVFRQKHLANSKTGR